MALTMVHLLVADRWAAGRPEYRENPEYYYGAISPDAIHIRDGNDKSHKNEIHLNNWRSLNRQDVIDYWHAHRTPFDVGYGVHVLTDAQWVPRYIKRLPGLLPGGVLDIPRYYNDTFVTDFELYRKSPRLRQMIDMIETAAVPGDHPLLTGDEFDQWRRMIVKAYRGPCPKDGPAIYIDEAYVMSFVDECVAMIDEIYGRSGLPDG